MGKYSKDKRDIYYRKAKELGFRARSAFKLIQIDEEFNVLKDVKRAVDLCAAPGSWSQVLSRKLYCKNSNSKDVKIVAVDLQKMAPIAGVIQIEGDITSVDTAQKIINLFNGEKADLVVCDGAPDVTGMHDIDEYIQSQLILSALNITTYLLRKNGNFICKIFRGRDINLLYTKLEIFFTSISVAKPKSSRNSSIEAFIVCTGYNPPNDYLPNMNILQFNKFDNITKGIDSNNYYDKNKFNHKKTILFVACGDLSAYDSDSNYPLINNKNNTSNSYDFITPLQPPTNPNYKHFMSLKQNQVFNTNDLDEDNIINSIQEKDEKKETKIDILEYSDIDVSTIASPAKFNNNNNNNNNNNDKNTRDIKGYKITTKSKKSQNRNRNRNQIAFYSFLVGAAVGVFYLTKFYYQTHQSNDNRDNIEFRKK